MTIEDVLRDTFRDREQHVRERELVAPVKQRVARQNRRRAVGAGVAIVAVLAGAGVVHLIDRPAPTRPIARENTAGWVAHGTAGAQIRVPATWAVNDYGCNMSDRPTVVRARGAQRLCFTPEAATKEVAIFSPWVELPNTISNEPSKGPEVPAGVTADRRPVAIDGIPAERATFQLPDGRYAGWIKVPSRNLALSVRTLSEARTTAILGSLEFVTVDANGCSVKKRVAVDPGWWEASPDTVPVAAPADRIAICYYNHAASTLAVSASLEGDRAAQVVRALNASERGLNPDCTHRRPTGPPELELLLFDGAGRQLEQIEVRAQGCAERGVRYKGIRAKVTRSLVDLLTSPLHTGYSAANDLPE